MFTKSEPSGFICGTSPWNLPLTQAVGAIAAALVAGNVIVAKPAEITSQTTVAMARIARPPRLPPSDGPAPDACRPGSTAAT